jgi:hypothetical protein
MIFLYILYKVYAIMFGKGGGGAGNKAQVEYFKNVEGKPENPKVFFDVKIGDRAPERIEFELFRCGLNNYFCLFFFLFF